MSDTLDALRSRRRELETALVTLQARIDEIDKLLGIIEHAPRPRVVTNNEAAE